MNNTVRQPGWLGCIAAAAIIMLIAGSAAVRAEGDNPNPYKRSKLPNGLELVVIENHTVPLATIAIAVRNGAFTEPDEFAGLSHLYEHMFFKANDTLPSQELFMKRIRQLGIVFNGYTSEEVVVYFFTLPVRNLEPGMKFMADAIMTPKFNQEELIKERQVVIGEFDRNEAQPEFPLRYAMDSAMWMPYVSRKQPLGQRQVILTATTAKMKMIQGKYYMPNNSALIVSGDVKPEMVKKLADKYLANWQAGEYPFPKNDPPVFPPLQPKLVIRETKGLPSAILRMAQRGPSIDRNSKDWLAGELLSTLCNQDISRFYKNLVDSGYALNAFYGYDPTRNVSDPEFYLAVPNEKIKAAYDVLRKEIAAMTKPGYFSDEEMAICKRSIANRLLFEQDNAQGFAISPTARWWSKASLDMYLSFAGDIGKLSEADVINYLNKYVTGKPFVLGIGANAETLKNLNMTEEALKW